MPLSKKLKSNLRNLDYKSPTEIQDKSFEIISELKDVLGIAHTGTGKTAAFLLPLINNLLHSKHPFETLVILPTRELAEQVEQEFIKITKGLSLWSISLIGGRPLFKDITKLKKYHHIVIGTPGRLCDLVRQKKLNINHFAILVIDEFDRLLDMGFQEDVFFLANRMKNRIQTLLFSATLDAKQAPLVDQLLNQATEIKVSTGLATAEHIQQEIVYTTKDSKFDTLLEMLQKDEFEKVLVFAETKVTVSDICFKLKKNHIKAEEIHGDKSQDYRKKALERFKNNKAQVLVATDVAARGLDIPNVTQVINYQIPQNYETYIHRIGRTGRAGKMGTAYTLVTAKPKKEVRVKLNENENTLDKAPKSRKEHTDANSRFDRKKKFGKKKSFKKD